MRNLIKNIVYGGLDIVKSDSEGYSVLRVIGGKMKGLKLRIILKKDSAYFWGKYDNHLLELIQKIAKPEWTFWDCGTYLGMYSVFFAKLANHGGKVISFEPDPHNLGRTRHNVALNGFGNVTFSQTAVADIDGDIEFIIAGNTNSHLPIGWIGATKEDYRKIELKLSTVKVRAHTLDTMARLFGIPDFVKLDIEGAEITALNHTKMLTDSRRTILLIESHNPETDTKIFNFAQEASYSLRRAEVTGCSIVSTVAESGGTMLAYPMEMKLAIE
jgi:FkbM family methyltransferase